MFFAYFDLLFHSFIHSGFVRAEYKSSSFDDLLNFEDGLYETGGERNRNPDLVPVPSNSYLGNHSLTFVCIEGAQLCTHH